jgi:Tfp pilus tip-associated adhesin PilY1
VTFTDAPGMNVKIMASYSHYAYTASSALKAFNNANVTADILALNNRKVNDIRYIHDFNGDNNFSEDDADWLVQWTRGYKDPGTNTQKAWKLGPIDHSTPALLVPPGYPLWYFGSQVTKAERDKYKEFKDAMEDRDSVLFVGSRDGMLHAFDAGEYRYGDNPNTPGIEENRGYFKWEDKPSPAPDYCASYSDKCPDYGTGEELWAFIPANLLPRLKNNILKADDQSFVDASPALADVYIDYTSPKDGQADTWRTVLLSAEGNGGDTVFCLDVTDPQNPTFMWEYAAPDLFRSRSSPAVAQIGRIRDPNGTDAVKWVAFFVTGKVEDSTLFPSIYMIDIADGSVLRQVVLDDPIDLDGSGTIEGAEIDYGKGGVPSGQPAIVDSDENGYIDRLYVATDKGLMYKVNIPDDPKNPASWDISHCVLNMDFTDDDNNTIPNDQRLHPIYASPAIVVDNSITAGGDIAYKIMVFFGTGDNPYYDENINTATTRYHFFAYVDTNEKGDCDPDKHKLDWFIELPAGNRIFASAFAAAGQIYFGTSTADTEDPCEGHLTPEGNEGRIYAVTLEGVVLLNKVVGDIRTSPLVEDEHLYFRTPTGLQSLGSGIYNNEVQAAGEPTINIRSWREIIN